MSELGIVWSSKGDQFIFGLKNGHTVNFGEIIKVVTDKRNFYARVTNMESGYTLKPEELLKEMIGNEGFGPYSKFRSVEAHLMLESMEEKMRLPTFNPTCADKIFPTTKNDHQLLKLEGDLHIGYLRSGDQKSIQVGILANALPKHIGLFGVTGSGKTNVELILNGRILETSGVVGLIFDFHGELWEGKGGLEKGMKDHPFFSIKGHFYTGDQLKIGLRTLWTSDIFEIFPDLTDPQRRTCKELEKEVGLGWVQHVVEYGVPQNLKSHKESISAILRRLHSLSEENFPDTDYSIANDVAEDIKNGNTVLIDLSGLDIEVQKMIVCIITKRVAGEYKKLFKTGIREWESLPTLLITLEEAHEFLEHQKEKRTYFSNIALTYRKYRVGLCVVTPRPSRIDPDVFAELWTKIIMKTTFRNDREYITQNTPYLEYSDVEIKVLDQGEALLVSEPQLRFAVPIKTIHYPEYLENIELKSSSNITPKEVIPFHGEWSKV